MDVAGLLIELYGRIPPRAEEVVAGLPAARLSEAPGADRNTIAWLVWHLARVQDSHIAELMPADQLWATGDWAERMGLAADPHDTGYGHTPLQVAAVRPPDGDVLVDYLRAVAGRTEGYLARLAPEDLDQVIDRRWEPPVTLGVRLVSVADDCIQHAGQAAYVRGLLGA
jgi:DinB superfamily